MQAELWKTEYDELEDDDNFIHYVEMMNRQVPHAAVAAKLERDGEDEETVRIAHKNQFMNYFAQKLIESELCLILFCFISCRLNLASNLDYSLFCFWAAKRLVSSVSCTSTGKTLGLQMRP